MRSVGQLGEDLACAYLRRAGMEVIAKNFHSRFGEIDLIMRDSNTVVFVEVKLRSSHAFGSALEAITKQKLKKMEKTAYFFLTQNRLNAYPFRFDAVEVDLSDRNNPVVQHVPHIGW